MRLSPSSSLFDVLSSELLLMFPTGITIKTQRPYRYIRFDARDYGPEVDVEPCYWHYYTGMAGRIDLLCD